MERGGEPWFVAKDVCEVLGHVHTPTALASHVDDDRQPFLLNTVSNPHSIRGNPRVSIINESGLYCLILGARNPVAKACEWVTAEVLPGIRKTGSFGATTQPNLADAASFRVPTPRLHREGAGAGGHRRRVSSACKHMYAQTPRRTGTLAAARAVLPPQKCPSELGPPQVARGTKRR
ncbi:hypothetical protein CJO90_08105 [Ralstonia solanacearum]|nr:hypothetical protein CJO90_08105 [Ralstonia solanacearum]